MIAFKCVGNKLFPKLKRLMDDPPRIGGKYDNLVRKLPTNHSVFYNAEADNFERVDHKKVLHKMPVSQVRLKPHEISKSSKYFVFFAGSELRASVQRGQGRDRGLYERDEGDL